MNLVIDANELFSAIIAKGRGRQTKKLDILFSDKINLFAPSILFSELEEHAEEIKLKSKFSDTDFTLFIALIELMIKVVPEKDFSKKLQEAKKISPDEKDIPYFAVALKLNCDIWSGDKKLKEQPSVRVLNTKELLELLAKLKESI